MLAPQNGLPERTYHGIIPPKGPRKVIIKEPGSGDRSLPAVDGRQDFNWGYGGGGPSKLADSLVMDVFEDLEYVEAFGWHFRDNMVKTFSKDKPFSVGRDRIVLESLIVLNDLIAQSKGPQGGWLIPVIQKLVGNKDLVRSKMLDLLSKDALANLIKSRWGVQ